MNTINRTFIGTAGLALAAMMVATQDTGALAATYETPTTGFETTHPIYTYPSSGYETSEPIYTYPATGIETTNPVYTVPASGSAPGSIV